MSFHIFIYFSFCIIQCIILYLLDTLSLSLSLSLLQLQGFHSFLSLFFSFSLAFFFLIIHYLHFFRNTLFSNCFDIYIYIYTLPTLSTFITFLLHLLFLLFFYSFYDIIFLVFILFGGNFYAIYFWF